MDDWVAVNAKCTEKSLLAERKATKTNKESKRKSFEKLVTQFVRTYIRNTLHNTFFIVYINFGTKPMSTSIVISTLPSVKDNNTNA